MDHDNKAQSLRQWWLDYISNFRVEYEKLPLSEQKGITNSNNFLKPCQIEVFWVTDPDYQIIIQSNFSDRLDKEIIINGPYKPYEFQPKTITILGEERWSRSMAHDSPHPFEHDTLGKMMATAIYRFVEMIKQSIFQIPQHDNKMLMGISVGDTWTSMYAGNIGDTDHVQKGKMVIQEIKQNIKLKQKNQPLFQRPKRSNTYTGFGIHFFPPILLGEEPKPSIMTLVYNTSPYVWTYNNKAFDMKIKQHQIIVNNDGFIFVEIENKEQALKLLNLIMACGAFYNFRLHAVREHELVLADYDKQNLTLSSMQWESETRRAFLLDRFNSKNTHLVRTTTKPDTIREILLNTEKLLEHEKLAADMRLFNEGLTHFQNSEFAQSFIMSWSVIERHYSDIWNTLLSSKNIDHERFSKLINPNQWTIDSVLEFLSLQEEIDETSYDLLMDLKKKRNKFYHNGKQIIKGDAERCIKHAMGLLTKKIKRQIHISNDLVLAKRQSNIKLE